MSRNLVAGAVLTLLIGFTLTAPSAVSAQPAAGMQKASQWLGRDVATSDGQHVGRVEDFAIDQSTGNISFVVVSVGSFLIEHNLIAVDPAALRPVPGVDGVLVLEADPETLRNAKRFANDQWPTAADVVRSPSAPSVAALPEGYQPRNVPEPQAESGTASITDGLRTAYLTPGERTIQTRLETPPPPAPPPRRKVARPPGTPLTKFDRLDKDGDDVLDRAEIALEISPDDKYSDLDLDASGYIDRDEFDAFEQRHEAAN